MKNFTFPRRVNATLVALFLLCLTHNLFSQTTEIHKATFEGGNFGWSLSGTNTTRLNNSTLSYQGNEFLRLTFNGSIAQRNNLDLTSYDKVDIQIFIRRSTTMNNSHRMVIEYRPDNSSSWNTIATVVNGFASGTSWRDINNLTYNSYTASIFKTDYTFGSASQFRLVMTTNSNFRYFYIDNITITGTTYNSITLAPGGITSALTLWLKADKVTGSTVQGNNSDVNTWVDKGLGNNAKVTDESNASLRRPLYKNNANDNVNFNPVVAFNNNPNSAPKSFSFLDSNRDHLQATGGFNTQELYVVVVPDITVNSSLFPPMDLFCGQNTITNTWDEDVTGYGFGDYSARFDNEMVAFANGTNPNPTPTDPNLRGYGIAEIGATVYDSNSVLVLSARNTTAGTSQELFMNGNDIGLHEVGVPQFANSNNRRFWLGRSQAFAGSFNGRIAEVISYDSRKNDGVERPRIESYLAVKYGITLGVNGISQDYVNSDGTVIWDVNTGVPANDVFNYDIAGIGRDDASDLHQKQSRSINNASDGIGRTQGVLTMGITDLFDTNSDNPNTVSNKRFLMWGNNGVNLNDPAVIVDVNMSTDISPALESWVQFNGIARTWKVVETGGDFPSVKVSMLRSAIRTATPPNGRFLMFISDTPNFDPTADYRVMNEELNELGQPVVTTNYDFDNTKYITFGWAPERVYERSITFNGINNFIDMEDNLNLNTSGFTVSAWIKRDVNSGGKSILSKRATAYGGVRGYDFRILPDGRFNVRWRNSSGSNQEFTSSIAIPLNVWHHLAVIYNGSTATMYIDGVADTSANLTPPAAWTHSFLIGAGGKGTIDAFFHGSIDEVRVWNTNLTPAQLRFVMNQEIENNAGFVRGSYFQSLGINPTKNDIATIPWNALAAYYPMTTYTYTNTKDESGNGVQGALRALRTVDRQTAPLPYISAQNGDWNTNATWTNGAIQTIPGTTSIVDDKVTVDWNIVETSHNITMNNASLPAGNAGNRSTLALLVNANTLELNGDNASNTGNGITVTHYLKLDGTIDLEGESQLIQTLGSDFDPTSSGRLERDQQGTADTFTYNYWSSPVGTRNSTTNNNSYTVPTVLQDGTSSITFIPTGFNGSNTSPIGIADYWIWKFANQATGQYSAWQHVRSTGSLLAGEGFTMKGPGSGAVADDQNYVFNGKPNNGDINLTLAANSDYLVGNPYPSAINADQFILDNGPVLGGTGTLDGTLFFWEHWGGGSHILREYQGGYATYNLSGGAPSANQGVNHPDVGMGGTARKTPGRFIPVSQGFFVTAEGSGGTINFNNGQRVFEKEDGGLSSSSVFMRSANENYYRVVTDENDPRMKFRIGFLSANSIQRQLLLTIDEKATTNRDWGYDAKLNEIQIDDLYWIIEENEYVIQGSDILDDVIRYPLGVKSSSDGMNEISINVLENVPDNIAVYVHDNQIDYYHHLNESPYEFFIFEGEYLNRFDILFNRPDASLSIDDETIKSLNAIFANTNETIVLSNPTGVEIKSLEMLNILGQSIAMFDNISDSSLSEYEVKNLSAGTYIIKINTVSGSVSKKVIVN